MTSNHENDGTLIVRAQQLRTVEDCHKITSVDGWGFFVPQRPNQVLSAALVSHLKNFSGSLKLANLLIRHTEPDKDRDLWMFSGLIEIAKDIAQEGFVIKYAVYTTAEKLQGCFIGVLSTNEYHDGMFRVPLRIDDLLRGNFVRRVPASDSPSAEATKNEQQRHRRLNPSEIQDMVLRLRKRYAMSPEILAARSKVTTHTIQRIETGARVDDDCLHKVARAFQLREDLFTAELIPVETYEQMWSEYQKEIKGSERAEARTVTTLEDCDAILTVRGYSIDPQEVPDNLWSLVEGFVDTLKSWSHDYLNIGPTTRHDGCTKLLSCVQQLDAHGFRTDYVTYRSQDNITGATVKFVPRTHRGTERLPIPRRLNGILRSARSREEE